MAAALATVMMTRPFIILLAGTLLAAGTAHAERRSKRDRDRDRGGDEEEETTTKNAKRSIGGDDRRRAAKSIEEDEDVDASEEDDRPSKKKKKKTAAAPGETPDTDGTEAIGYVPIRVTDLIEVAVRHAPNLARAKLERAAAKGEAGASRLDQAWVLTAKGEYSKWGVGGDVELNLLDPRLAALRELSVDRAAFEAVFEESLCILQGVSSNQPDPARCNDLLDL
jgi:hypothetical protein